MTMTTPRRPVTPPGDCPLPHNDPARRGQLLRLGRAGQTTSEMMLLIAVVVISVVSAGYLFIPGFAEGVIALGQDVRAMLSSGEIKDAGASGVASGGAEPGGAQGGGYGDGGYDDGGAGGGPGGLGGGGGSSSGGDDGSEGSAGAGDDGGEDDSGEDDSGGEDADDEAACPYTYDEVSGRWRDPETGQYVSGADASAAGC